MIVSVILSLRARDSNVVQLVPTFLFRQYLGNILTLTDKMITTESDNKR